MLADNCRLLCQLDTLVLLTNRSAKLKQTTYKNLLKFTRFLKKFFD